MCFWHVLDPEFTENEDASEELLSHFDGKVLALFGEELREKFSATETEIMDCIREREEIWNEIIHASSMKSVILGLFSLGPWRTVKIREATGGWGPDPLDFVRRIKERRRAARENKLIDV